MDSKIIKVAFSDREIELLAQTLFLGNWIINSCKLEEEVLEKHDLIFKKIADLYKEKTLECHNKKIEDIHKHLYAQTESHLDSYHNAILFDLLSKKLAEYYFPVNLNDTENLLRAHSMQKAARRAYEQEFNTNNFANLEINIPNLKEQLDAAQKNM